MKWKILNATILDSSFKITGMEIKLQTDTSMMICWGDQCKPEGFKKQSETINFIIKNSQLVAEQNQITTSYFKEKQHLKDSTYLIKMDNSINVNKVKQVLDDMYSQKMLFKIPVEDSLITINLKNKKNGHSDFSYSVSDNYYRLHLLINTNQNTINLSYDFTEAMNKGLVIGNNNLKTILDWLYIYQLTNLLLPNHEITKKFFNKSNLENIIKWAN